MRLHAYAPFNAIATNFSATVKAKMNGDEIDRLGESIRGIQSSFPGHTISYNVAAGVSTTPDVLSGGTLTDVTVTWEVPDTYDLKGKNKGTVERELIKKNLPIRVPAKK